MERPKFMLYGLIWIYMLAERLLSFFLAVKKIWCYDLLKPVECDVYVQLEN